MPNPQGLRRHQPCHDAPRCAQSPQARTEQNPHQTKASQSRHQPRFPSGLARILTIHDPALRYASSRLNLFSLWEYASPIFTACERESMGCNTRQLVVEQRQFLGHRLLYQLSLHDVQALLWVLSRLALEISGVEITFSLAD